MSNVYPLNQQSYRLPGPPEPEDAGDVTVTAEGTDLVPYFDESTNSTVYSFPDGTVQVMDGPPEAPRGTSKEFSENIAELMTDAELSTIAERLLRGIEQDEQSRSGWLTNMASGISLLGLQIKAPAGAAASGATPAEGTSVVDHPLLLEAVLRFQANAVGELLPADGPVKVKSNGGGNGFSDMLADALEKDLNHYLTKVATEYYPDTDKMLLLLGFSGISFKKGYHDPIKRRPVIASIDAKDLIVSNAATDIEGAGRVTHRIMMRPSIMKRMQLVGAYRNVRLPSPGTPTIKNAVDAKIDQTQGIAPQSYLEPEDQEREIYECYCEYDIPGFEHEIGGHASGLPLPYKVTIDKEARQILGIHRHWDEDDEFCMPENNIIAYIFIPGLGFYGIGLLNILGNATKAVTAAWRLMIDAGMFSNFPGFLYLKSLAKQLTNNFRVPPGGGMPLDSVSGTDIRSMVMPLPYKDPSAVFIQLIENIATTAQRVGGTAELQVGEGKQDAPVGTTLAMIEQATKLMSAVHKRLYRAQGEEFSLLKKLLSEDPSALWRHNKKSKVLALLIQQAGMQQVADAEDQAEKKHHALFLAALDDCELVPAADPNTSTQTERYLKVVAARQMASTNQSIDLNTIDKKAFQTMGWDDPDQYFKPPPEPGTEQPAPDQIMAQATKTAAEADLMNAQTKAKELEFKQQTLPFEGAEAQAERDSKEKIAGLDVAKEIIIHNADQGEAARQFDEQNRQKGADRIHKSVVAFGGHRAKASEGAAQRFHTMQQTGLGFAHDAHQAGLDRLHEAQQSGLSQQHELFKGGVANWNDAQQGAMDQAHEANQGVADRTHAAQQAELDRRHEQALNVAKLKAQAAKPKPAAPKGKK